MGRVEVSSSRVLIAVALFSSIICLVIAPATLPESYSVAEHTTNEAAAQATEGAWLARTGLALFGLGVFCLGIVKRGWPESGRILHGLFGLLLIAAAVYSHRPFLDGVPYDTVEDLLHSVAATAMGFAFAAGVLVVGWRRIPRWGRVDVVALVAAVAIPIAMSATDGYDGLLQRGMFAIAYLWYLLEVRDTRHKMAFDTIG